MQIRMINNDYYNRYNPIAFKQVLRNDIPSEAISNKNYVVTITGPSGVGKDTVIDLMSDQFTKVVTCTTRAKRPKEVDGQSYYFLTKEQFEDDIDNNKFAEYIKIFGGNYYGTKKETIKNALSSGKPVLLNIDVEGARKIRESFKDDPEVNVVSIFFRPPSFEVLEKRLRHRESKLAKTPEQAEAIEKSIQERLARADYEISRAGEFDAEIAFNTPEEGRDDIKELLHLNVNA